MKDNMSKPFTDLCFLQSTAQIPKHEIKYQTFSTNMQLKHASGSDHCVCWCVNCGPEAGIKESNKYRQTFNVSSTKFQNLNVSRFVL